MNFSGLAVLGGAAALIILRLLMIGQTGPAWGLNTLRYLNSGQVLVWTLAALIVLLPPIYKRSALDRWQDTGRPWPAWIIGLALIALAYFAPSVSVPLLGDGLDRIDSTVAGWRSLEGQPAPLDLAVRIMVYKSGLFSSPGWNGARKAWMMTSYFSGGLAGAFLWLLAGLRAPERGVRWFIFITTFFAGTAVFFFGYVENYVLLAAGLYGYYYLFELVSRERAPAWALGPALALLVGLHYFMIFLLPTTLFALFRHGIWRPSRVFLVAAGFLVAGFCVMAASVIDEYYGGIRAIFVSPGGLFGPYHLIGWLNQHLLACPALPVLLLAAALARRVPAGEAGQDGGGGEVRGDALQTFLGVSSVVMLMFFFALRPVIGPSADWDLFSIPSLFYTPWLVLGIARRMGRGTRLSLMAWSLMVLSVATAGPWISLNSSNNSQVERFRELMDWEARYNPWAASYGYLRLGKYLARNPWERDNPAIEESIELAVEINPDSATLRLQAAQAYRRMGREDKAKFQMSMHHVLMGEYEERMGRNGPAAEQYRRALEVFPGNERALSSLVRLYQGPLSDPEKAEIYRRLLRDVGEAGE